MKEKIILWAKHFTLGIPLAITSLPLHWALRGTAGVYGLMCRFMRKLGYKNSISNNGEALEAVILINDLRKSGGKWAQDDFLQVLNFYYEDYQRSKEKNEG